MLKPKYLLAVDFAFAIAYLLNRATGSLSSTITTLVELDREGTLQSWYSASKFLLLAVLWTWVASRAAGGLAWRRCIAPLLFLAMSADEGSELHETAGAILRRKVLSYAVPTWAEPSGTWLALAPFALLAVIVAVRALRRVPVFSALASGMCLAGFVILLGSAMGIEIFGTFAAEGSWAMAIEVACEELGEMVGATLLMWGSWEATQALRERDGLQPGLVDAARTESRAAAD